HIYDYQEVSGHIIRAITPLYYERYEYDKETGIIALVYIEETYSNQKVYHYEKYSKEKKLYLKNIAFNGNLYNLNNYNDGEEGYIGEKDNGGYFIGGSYMFRGVSTKEGKEEFYLDMFMVACGFIPGPIGIAVTCIGALNEIMNFAFDSIKEFNGVITNEEDYSFSMNDIERQKQLEKYGHLLKDYVTVLDTPDNEDGVMFGIDKGCYAQATMYYKYANEENKSNTGFAGRVKLDIVEEIRHNISASEVVPIATDIESNSYSEDIYNDKILEINEDELTDVYNLEDRTCSMSFTAPENGIYTFETFGSVKNEFINVPFGTITDKADGYNQKVIVRLNKGEKFEFLSQNTSGSNGVYQIKAEFTPTEIGIDETKTLNIKAGESEFFTYNNAGNVGLNYSLDTKGCYDVSFLSADRSEVINTANMESKNSNAIILNSAGKYLIKITNNDIIDAEIDFSLTSVTQINSGQVYDLEIGHKALYKFGSIENSLIRFEWKTLGAIKVSLLDEDFNILISKEDVTNSFTWSFEKNKTYYFLFENDNYNVRNANFELIYSPQRLMLGDNVISKDQESMTYEISLSTDAQIKIEADNGITLSFFDSEWNSINAQNGLYTTIGGNRYFIVTRGETRTFTLNVTLDYTDELSEQIGEEGYRFIRFSPAKSDTYEVSGVAKFEWYDDLLRSFGSNLYVGDTYYLKIYGDSNSDYNITISRKVTSIALRNRINLKSGVYSFEIEESGTYTVSTAISNNVTASYSIINLRNEHLISNVNAGVKYFLHFDAGIYYIEIETSNDVEVLINFLNADNTQLNGRLIDGENHSVVFKDNTDNTFVFVANKSDEYYLTISYSGARLIFDITVTDKEGNEIDFTELDIKQDVQGTRYGIKLDLVKDKTYNINVYYPNVGVTSSGEMPAEVMIYLPKIVKSVKLLPENSSTSVTIIENRLEVKPSPRIYMGRMHTLQVLNAANEPINVDWEISSTSGAEIEKGENKFLVKPNQDNDSITLILRDDREILTINVYLDVPYISDASIDVWNGSLDIKPVNNDKQNNNNDAKITKIRLEDSFGHITEEILDNSYSLFKAFEAGLKIVDADCNIFYTSFIEMDNGYKYWYTNEKGIAPKFVKIKEINSSVLQNKDGIIIDTRNTDVNNVTYEVPGATPKMFLLGNKNEILNNVRFNFAAGNMTLYLMNYNVNANNNTVLEFDQTSDNSE
ncbi:MAG: hypothetical protein K2H36_00755, partial [Clostridia bacterium]|nr:hypothetical protein [Clostridia bacterium]